MTGHKLSGEENPYSIPKLEQLREVYSKAEPKLSVSVSSVQVDRVKSIKRRMITLCEEKKTTPEDLVKELQKYVPGLSVVQWWKPRPSREPTEEEIRAYEEAMREYDKKLLEDKIKGDLEKSLRESIMKEILATPKMKSKEQQNPTMTNGNGPRYESKLVTEQELTKFLNQGWGIVGTVNKVQ